MYTDFADFYDLLMQDVDYAARTEYLVELFRKYDRMPTLLLDLACGTGGFTNEFAGRGCTVIGVDLSPEMLCRARDNAADAGVEPLFLCQDARELDLYGTVDGAICCMDSLNHLTDYDGFAAAIARVALFLEPGRLFLFDLNTVYKQECILGDRTFLIEEEDLFCTWDNAYDPETHTTEITLDFFSHQEDGSYLRTGDTVTERAYTAQEVANALDAAGLEQVAVLEELTDHAPSATAERVVYVTRRR